MNEKELLKELIKEWMVYTECFSSDNLHSYYPAE